MDLRNTWQRVRDLFSPPDARTLQARHASLRREADAWAAQQTEMLALNQVQMMQAGICPDDKMVPGLPPGQSILIRSGVPGGTGGSFLDGSESDVEMGLYTVTRQDVPFDQASEMLTEPEDAELVVGEGGQVALYRVVRYYKDYDREAFDRLEELAHELADPSYPDEWPPAGPALRS